MRRVQVNLAYRRYIGYDLDETVPDHSAIFRNRSLFGRELFQQLFDQVVKLGVQEGLTSPPWIPPLSVSMTPSLLPPCYSV